MNGMRSEGRLVQRHTLTLLARSKNEPDERSDSCHKKITAGKNSTLTDRQADQHGYVEFFKAETARFRTQKGGGCLHIRQKSLSRFATLNSDKRRVTGVQ